MPDLKVVIFGGVAGGATAAARLRRLREDAQIVILERGPFVSFANCGLPYHIGGEIADRARLLLQTPESLKARHRLEVRIRHEVLSIDRTRKTLTVRDLEADRTYQETYDKLIISTGALPVRPPLPGIDDPRLFTLRNIPDMDAIKQVVDDGAKAAIVVGGGFIGLEVTENLRRRGLAVHLVEMLDQVMPSLDREMATALHQALLRQGVDLRLGDAVEGFTEQEGRLAARLKSGTSLVADLAILAIGVKPDAQLARQANLALGERGGIKVDEHLRTSDPDIYAVGDAVVSQDCVTGQETLVPLAGPANRQARIAVDHLCGRASRYRGTQGTSIVRVFDMTAATTGASEKTLRRIGLEYAKVYLHPTQHVTYFPGAEPMHLKLLFARSDGRILGAQITGGEGVDKRIDVLATSLQAGLTVFDLEEAELAYSPQFGAAKDPVNMAGFVAANLLRGDVQTVHADHLDPQALLLDVRERSEHQAGAIPGSVLIPLGELRERHSELPRQQPIIVYCAAGLRGYMACRTLTQLGYDVANLSGGYRTYRAFYPAAPNPADRQSNTDVVKTIGCDYTGRPAKPADETAPQASRRSQTMPDSSQPAIPPSLLLDVRGQQCPGPIVAINEAIARLSEGQTLRVLATDPGFAADIPAWCRQTGNELVSVGPQEGYLVAVIHKQTMKGVGPATCRAQTGNATDRTIVVFSSDLDRVLAAFVIANGAAAMGRKVTLFFTFWGLNALRRPVAPPLGKSFLDRMFGMMMPRGAEKLKLSKMNMAGLGTALMKNVMKDKKIASLPELIVAAQKAGVRLVACSMSMEVMGIQPQELIDGVEVGGVGSYLDAADQANVNLFI